MLWWRFRAFYSDDPSSNPTEAKGLCKMNLLRAFYKNVPLDPRAVNRLVNKRCLFKGYLWLLMGQVSSPKLLDIRCRQILFSMMFLPNRLLSKS